MRRALCKLAEIARLTLGCQIAAIRIAATPDRPAGEIVVSTTLGCHWSGDPAVLTDPVAASENGFGFFAGLPLQFAGDTPGGILVALDSGPRELPEGQYEILKLLADTMVELVALGA